MKNIIEELYYGNIDPNMQAIVRNSDYDRAMRVVSENEDLLSRLLDGKERELFLNYANSGSELLGITAVEKFTAGFRLGALIMRDVLGEQDGCLRDIV